MDRIPEPLGESERLLRWRTNSALVTLRGPIRESFHTMNTFEPSDLDRQG